MSGIRGKNTKPEMLVRRGLHAMGFRFRLHAAGMHGRPDMVLPKYRAVIFIHGCFWHGHNCHLFRLPGTRPDFWRVKIEGNRTRDALAESRLMAEGWRVGTVWECSLRGRGALPLTEVLDTCGDWLRGDTPSMQVRGNDETRNAL